MRPAFRSRRFFFFFVRFRSITGVFFPGHFAVRRGLFFLGPFRRTPYQVSRGRIIFGVRFAIGDFFVWVVFRRKRFFIVSSSTEEAF